MEAVEIDVRIKLSILWVSRMLTGYLGDILRFFEPGILEQIITGEIFGDTPMTDELMLGMAIITVIPIVMVFPSLTLKAKANRRVNMSIGIFMVGYDLFFLITSIASPA